MSSRKTTPIIARFGQKVFLAQHGCWEWAGALNDCGYGILGRGRRGEGSVKAHRLAFELFNLVRLGPEQCVCHRCDNPRCVNPGHLFVGSQQENIADMFRKGRNKQPPVLVGPANPKAKLDAAKVRRVFELRREGFSTYSIADVLGVSRVAICQVLNRQTWRHVDVTSYHFC